MCQALMEIMESEINKIKQSVTQSVTQSIIASTVKSLHDFGISNSNMKDTLIRNFGLSAEEAEKYL